MNTDILEKIGLTKSEINVYFALCELGTSSVGKIILKSKAPNSKIYLILQRLIEKGLVTSYERSNVKYYVAESPNRLLDYLEIKKQEIDSEKLELKKLISVIKTKKSNQLENISKVFEGRRGIYSAYEDIIETLNGGEEMLYFSIGDEDLSQRWVQTFFKEFAKKRVQKRILSKGIYPNSMKKMIVASNKNKHFINFIDHSFPKGIVIYANKVLILDWKEPVVFMIINKNIAESYRGSFYSFWNTKK